MRFLFTATFPHEPFNTLVRKKKAGGVLRRILEDLKPETVFFTDDNGMRSAFMIVHLDDASSIPRFCEPFLLNFNADIRFRLIMSPDELGKAGLDELGEKWG